MRHEWDSPNLGGHLPHHPTPSAIIFPLGAGKWDSPNLGGHLPHHPTSPEITFPLGARKWAVARIIGLPTTLISEAIIESHLPSK
ncbi:hypothetical protein AVEN_191084-1 [Araneus ventricosus]|uniref:Uncharacterized protein n=1 Tax=Araneus ventricosus TaxID=182803 RepID=A0A4Y2AXZ0_ARAVE|nr:hypothetical protein AVEN_191084-1 [Araneus ventricosus]